MLQIFGNGASMKTYNLFQLKVRWWELDLGDRFLNWHEHREGNWKVSDNRGYA